MISTIFIVSGMNTSADARAIQGRLYQVSDVGGVATEIIPGGDSRIIIKHKDDVQLDRAALQAALQKAGNYTLS